MNRRARLVKDFQDWLAGYPCVACGRAGVELHHVDGMRSLKTGQRIQPRQGLAYYAQVPLCPPHHRLDRDSAQAIGDERFGVVHLGGADALLGYALAFVVTYLHITRGGTVSWREAA